MKNKYLLTILLIIGIIFFIPKNVEAANPAPAFKCFYKLDVTEGSDKKTYTLKLIYVNGEVKAIKYEDGKSGLITENNDWEMKDYKKAFSKLGMEKLTNVGSSCPTSVTATNGYITQGINTNGAPNQVTYYPKVKKERNKNFIYKLTSSGTQSLGTVSDKECTYTNSKKEPSTVDVYFYRTKYSSSYIKTNNKKIDGFWKSKNVFYAGSNNYTYSMNDGYYTSLHDYITKYSSKPTICPEKVFYNLNNGRLVAATGSIKNNQVEDTTNHLVGDDNDYTPYQFDKNKICRDEKKKHTQTLVELENMVTALESAVSQAGNNIDVTMAENLKKQYEDISKKLENYNKAVEGCESSAGYEDLKNRSKAIGEKITTLKQTLKDVIRNSTLLTDEQKSEYLKAVDKAFSKMSKLSSLDMDMYNKEQNCGSIFGDPNQTDSVAYIIQRILNYIKIIGPILVIILSSIDFIKAIWSSDDENMKKAQQKLAKRLAAAVLLFLLPSLVGLIISLLNSNITDPTCGIQ